MKRYLLYLLTFHERLGLGDARRFRPARLTNAFSGMFGGSPSGGSAPLHILQLLPGASDLASYSRDGCGLANGVWSLEGLVGLMNVRLESTMAAD